MSTTLRPSAFMFALSSLLIASGASEALAQPADRPAAFQSAIGASLALSPGWSFYEASLENDGGQWLFEVQVVSMAGTAMLEYEVDAMTNVILRSRNKSLSAGKISDIQATLASFASATITYQQAIAAAVPRTPFGTQMQQIETGIESAHPAYKFDFVDASDNTQRVNVDAATGTPSGGGGGGNPTPPGSGDLTLDQAIAVALTAYPGAKILETEFEASDARWEIKLVTTLGDARKLRISSPGGAILSDDPVKRSREEACDDRLKLSGLSGAMLTLTQCKQAAVNAAPGSTAAKAGWTYEKGKLVAKVEVEDSIGPRTILIDSTTGDVVTPVPPVVPAAPPVPVVDVAGAITAAVAANPGSAAIETEMELKGGRQFYKVKTLSLATPLRLREVVVDGKTGVVWSNTLLPMATTYLPTARLIVQLLPTATKTFADARTIALTTLADGQITSIELEPQSTFLVYNVDVLVASKTFSLVVDSRTGAVKPK